MARQTGRLENFKLFSDTQDLGFPVQLPGILAGFLFGRLIRRRHSTRSREGGRRVFGRPINVSAHDVTMRESLPSIQFPYSNGARGIARLYQQKGVT